MAQIHKALAPTYLKIRRVSANMRRRIYAPCPQTEILLKIGSSDRRNLPTPAYRGRIFTLDASAAPIDFLFKYGNEGDTSIHESTCARRIIYPVCVSRTSGVKLFPIYEAPPMQSYGPGNTSRCIFCRLRCT